MLYRIFKISAFGASAYAVSTFMRPAFKPYFRTVEEKARGTHYTEITRAKTPSSFQVFYKCYTQFLDVYDTFISNQLNDFMDKAHMKEATSVKVFKFNDSILLKDDRATFQNVLLAVVDSQMGYIAMLAFAKKPSVTAHIDYNFYGSLKEGERYVSYGFVDKQEGNNIWIKSEIIDSKGERVATFGSRFVKLNLDLI